MYTDFEPSILFAKAIINLHGIEKATKVFEKDNVTRLFMNLSDTAWVIKQKGNMFCHSAADSSIIFDRKGLFDITFITMFDTSTAFYRFEYSPNIALRNSSWIPKFDIGDGINTFEDTTVVDSVKRSYYDVAHTGWIVDIDTGNKLFISAVIPTEYVKHILHFLVRITSISTKYA